MRAIRLGRTAPWAVGVVVASSVALGLLTTPASSADREAAKPAKAAAKGGTAAKASRGAKVDAVDALLRDSWENGSVKPSANAADAEYLRRAYIDIVGRIPTAAEALDFLSTKDPNKRAKLVDVLVDHPDYAKNFSSIWTVILVGRRNQERGVDKGALTAWLRTQFKDNVPWNKTAYSLITADGSNKDNGACNFTLSHLEMGGVPLTSISMRVFMGQQIQCTQCHDHPSNDWKQGDFWGINAFYKGIRKEEVTKVDATGAEVPDYTRLYDEPTDAFATYDRRNAMVGIAFPKFLDGSTIPQSAEDNGQPVERRKRLGEMVTDPKNDQFAKAFVNRVWAHFMGRGFVNPVDDFGAHNQANNPELLDHLAAELKATGYDVKALIKLVCASQAYNVTSKTSSANDKDEVLFSHMMLKPMSPEQLFDSLIAATSAHKAGGGGDTDKKRAEWLRQFQFAYATDEGEESTSYQGTIPQALMMMNGPLIAKAVSGESGSFLANLLNAAQLQHKQPVGLFIVNRLYLAALSRYPTQRELAKANGFFEGTPPNGMVPLIEDIFWSLLNANEFILNH